MGTQIYLKLEGLIDRKVEVDRLTKEIGRMQGLIESTRKRLESDGFVSRAPADVVAKEREKLDGLVVNLEKLEKSLAALKA